MKLWYSTLFPLWCAVQGSSEFAIVDPGLPEVRGHFEVSITVTIGSASHVFEAQDRNIGNAVQRFCNRVTEETRTLEACVTELEAAAQDVLKRCLTLIHLPSEERAEACRWVVDSDAATQGSRGKEPNHRTGSLVDVVDAYAPGRGAGVEKYRHYFAIYEKSLSHLRGRFFRMLEIGIADGGSVDIWREWLGPRFEFHGIDIDARARRFDKLGNSTHGGARIHIGSQADPAFLRAVVRSAGDGFDVIIDDGGHTWEMQQTSFKELFPLLKPGGMYIVEDTHTSFWPAFGGSESSETFLDSVKSLIDTLHAWHMPGDSPARSRLSDSDWDFARTAKSISIFESVVVIEKHAHPISQTDLAPVIRGEFLSSDGTKHEKRKSISSAWLHGQDEDPHHGETVGNSNQKPHGGVGLFLLKGGGIGTAQYGHRSFEHVLLHALRWLQGDEAKRRRGEVGPSALQQPVVVVELHVMTTTTADAASMAWMQPFCPPQYWGGVHIAMVDGPETPNPHSTHKLHRGNYMIKLFQALDIAERHGLAYMASLDDDVMVSPAALALFLRAAPDAFSRTTAQEASPVAHPDCATLSPTLSTGIPSVELFLDAFIEEEDATQLKQCFSSSVDLDGLNPWSAKAYFEAVGNMETWFRGVHPVRYNNSCMSMMSHLAAAKVPTFWSREYRGQYGDGHSDDNGASLPMPEIRPSSCAEAHPQTNCRLLPFSVPYLANTFWMTTTHLYASLLRNHSGLFCDGFDECAMNQLVAALTTPSGGHCLVTPTFVLHPAYNTHPEFRDIEQAAFIAVAEHILDGHGGWAAATTDGRGIDEGGGESSDGKLHIANSTQIQAEVTAFELKLPHEVINFSTPTKELDIRRRGLYGVAKTLAASLELTSMTTGVMQCHNDVGCVARLIEGLLAPQHISQGGEILALGSSFPALSGNADGNYEPPFLLLHFLLRNEDYLGGLDGCFYFFLVRAVEDNAEVVHHAVLITKKKAPDLRQYLMHGSESWKRIDAQFGIHKFKRIRRNIDVRDMLLLSDTDGGTLEQVTDCFREIQVREFPSIDDFDGSLADVVKAKCADAAVANCGCFGLESYSDKGEAGVGRDVGSEVPHGGRHGEL